MRRSILIAAALTLFSAFTCAGQSPCSSPQQDTSQSQAQTEATLPVTPPPAASPDAGKPKKVWTDDDFSRTRNRSSVNSAKSTPKSQTGANKPVDASYISKTKKELDKLQADISDLDKQIAQLKSFNEGETVGTSGAVKLTKSFNRDPVPVQIQELQDKRKQLQDQIDALLDEARKKGVEPGQLR